MEIDPRVCLEYLNGGIAQIRLDNPPLNLTTVSIMQSLEQLIRQVADDPAVVICQDSCHVIQAASFTTLFSCRAGLSQTVAGRSQLRVEPRQRSGLAALASS